MSIKYIKDIVKMFVQIVLTICCESYSVFLFLILAFKICTLQLSCSLLIYPIKVLYYNKLVSYQFFFCIVTSKY